MDAWMKERIEKVTLELQELLKDEKTFCYEDSVDNLLWHLSRLTSSDDAEQTLERIENRTKWMHFVKNGDVNELANLLKVNENTVKALVDSIYEFSVYYKKSYDLAKDFKKLFVEELVEKEETEKLSFLLNSVCLEFLFGAKSYLLKCEIKSVFTKWEVDGKGKKRDIKALAHSKEELAEKLEFTMDKMEHMSKLVHETSTLENQMFDVEFHFEPFFATQDANVLDILFRIVPSDSPEHFTVYREMRKLQKTEIA